MMRSQLFYDFLLQNAPSEDALLDSIKSFSLTTLHFSIEIRLNWHWDLVFWMNEIFSFRQRNKRMNILHEFHWKTVSVVYFCTLSLSIKRIFLLKNLFGSPFVPFSTITMLCTIKVTRIMHKHDNDNGMPFHVHAFIPFVACVFESCAFLCYGTDVFETIPLEFDF